MEITGARRTREEVDDNKDQAKETEVEEEEEEDDDAVRLSDSTGLAC